MINYNISKHNNLGKDIKGNYVLWKEVESEHGCGARGIFQGTKKECEDKLKEIKR